MKLPNYQDYYPYILKFGDERRTADEYLELICEEMKIPEDAKSVRNDSGELTIRNRLRWAIHYLRRANLMDKPERAKYLPKHKTAKDCWIIIDSRVFDVTNFLSQHPGGKKVLTRVGGKDATEQFFQLHKNSVLDNVGSAFEIGKIKK